MDVTTNFSYLVRERVGIIGKMIAEGHVTINIILVLGEQGFLSALEGGQRPKEFLYDVPGIHIRLIKMSKHTAGLPS